MPEKTPFRKSIENLERELEKSQVAPWVARRLRESLAAYPPIFVLTREETEAAIGSAVGRAVPGGVGYEAPIAGIAQMTHERQKKPEGEA